MSAWLLIVALAGSSGYLVPNIASDEACKQLAATVRGEFYYVTPKLKCVAYPIASSPMIGDKDER
jgi:hypothetical protein